MAASMIDRCTDVALEALEAAEKRSGSVALRLQLGEALAALTKTRASLRSAFPPKVDQRFGQALEAVRASTAMAAGPAPAPLGESDLALMEHAEVSRFVEASRLQQTAMPVVEHALARLDSLMSSALGLPMVRAELNPLRPEVLCGALLELIEQQPDPPELRSLWVRHMAKPFAQELNRLYDSVATMLETQGVEEARYRLKLTESGPAPTASKGKASAPSAGGSASGAGGGRGGAGGGAGSSGVGEPMPSDAEQRRQRRALFPKMSQLAQAQPAVSQALMREFLYRPQFLAEHDEPLPANYYEDVQAQVAKLANASGASYDELAEGRSRARERALSVVDRPARQVGVGSPLAPQQWGEQASPQARTRALLDLKAKASKISQVLGMDAVRTLVSQVAADQRVLAPVREAFVAMEPALLRMAMSDPRYFGDDHHPARKLIEDVAQRSFKYNDEFAEDFEQFMAPVREAVRELNAVADPTKGDFAQRVDGLQAHWQAEDAGVQQASAPGMQSMRFAQERQALAEKFAWEFSLRSDLVGVPHAVVDFLFQDWSLVIAHAQLTAERSQLDPGGYLAVVSDMLWSVKREAALRQPARLIEVVPHVISTLRRGLAMLGKEPAESETFFDVLMRYHEPVLRLRRMLSARDAEASGFGRLSAESALTAFETEPVPLEPPKPRTAEQPWLGRAELAAAGFDDEIDTGEGSLSGTTLSGAVVLDAVDDESLSDESATLPPIEFKGEGRSVAPVPDPSPTPEHKGDSDDGSLVPQDATAGGASVDDAKLVPVPMEPAPPAPPQAPARRHETEEEAVARTRATLAGLRTGDWVDLRSRNIWRRAQLTWLSDNGSLFMFVSHGGRPHSMTRRSCEKLIRSRSLRPVDVGAVVDKALRSLPVKDLDEIAAEQSADELSAE